MHCPVCKTAALVMSERAGVEIDYCPQCRGVWLDRGELDKIIERSRQDNAAAQPSQRQEAPRQPEAQHYGHKPYRKKSFLEELFD